MKLEIIKKDNIVENFYLAIRNEVLVIGVNPLRATINEAADIRNLLEERIVLGDYKIVVDLNQCTQLDSTFIGVLVVIQKKLKLKGGELKLVEPLDPAKELFYLTGISNLFNNFETAEDALRSFNNGIKQLPEPKPDEIIFKQKTEWAFA